LSSRVLTAPQEPTTDNPLRKVTEMMRRVERQLKQAADHRAAVRHERLRTALEQQQAIAEALKAALRGRLGRDLDDTRDAQRRIVQHLDELIRRIEDVPPPPPPEGDDLSAPRAVGQAGNPAMDSTAPLGPDQKQPILQALDRVYGKGHRWLPQLPSARRTAILTACRQRLPDRWRRHLEHYYAALSKLQ
jgi:hypothetical protein